MGDDPNDIETAFAQDAEHGICTACHGLGEVDTIDGQTIGCPACMELEKDEEIARIKTALAALVEVIEAWSPECQCEISEDCPLRDKVATLNQAKELLKGGGDE
ncbi:MAG: hypothetical protein ACYSWU_17725 [Planctomycetota bacterium]